MQLPVPGLLHFGLRDSPGTLRENTTNQVQRQECKANTTCPTGKYESGTVLLMRIFVSGYDRNVGLLYKVIVNGQYRRQEKIVSAPYEWLKSRESI